MCVSVTPISVPGIQSLPELPSVALTGELMSGLDRISWLLLLPSLDKAVPHDTPYDPSPFLVLLPAVPVGNREDYCTATTSVALSNALSS